MKNYTHSNMSVTNIETEAFVVTEPKAPFKLTPIIHDEVRGKEILVEMKYTGICHTVRTSLASTKQGWARRHCY